MKGRVLPLLLFLAAVGLVWLVLHATGATATADEWLTAWIVLGWLLGIAVMLLGTRRWKPRGLGLLGTYLGDALLYGSLALLRFGVGGPIGRNRLDLMRAVFLVGSTLLIGGCLRWLWRTRLGRRPEPEDEGATDVGAVLVGGGTGAAGGGGGG